MKKSIVIFTLCVLLIISFCMTAFAGDLIMPCYTYTNEVKAKLSVSSGIATASGSIWPDGNLRTSVQVQLQRNDNGQWNTIATWRGSNSSGYSEAGGTKSLTSGYAYRTFTTGYVYNSDGVVIEVVSNKSSEKSY